MYREYNPNPLGLQVGDCVIRAASKVLEKRWTDVYSDLCVKGLEMADMPSSNRGFFRMELPDMRVRDFCVVHPRGTYVLATGTHVIAAIDGDYYDAWDSGNEVPTYYWSRNV